MLKQITKVALLLTIALSTLALTANAQTVPQRKVNIGFEFQVGNDIMPAGEYVIISSPSDSSRRLLVVRNTTTNQQAMVHVLPKSSNQTGQEQGIKFTQYGNTRFLNQVNLGDFTFALVKSSAERSLARQVTAQSEVR